MIRRSRKTNLLILGASGIVARAFLRRLGGWRGHFGRLVLLDKNEHVLADRFLEHHRLDYEFVRCRLRFPEDAARYRRLLRRYQIDAVLDVTDMDTLPVLEATDAVAALSNMSAVNTKPEQIQQVD